MDPLTHIVAGAVLGRATAPTIARPDGLSVRARMTAGALSAAIPDIDGLLSYVSPVAYLEQHRGLTHSVLLLPLWALALAWLFARVARDSRGPSPWFGICALGLASHTVLDVITGYGTMFLAPVSWHRFSLGTTFIIDLWFSGILIAGLAGALAFRRSRLPAMLALIGACAYVGLQFVLKERAEAFGVRHAAVRKLSDAKVVAHPRPVSPFNWTVFVTNGDRTEYSHVNLVRREAKPVPAPGAGFVERLDAPYRPLDDARWHSREHFGATPADRTLAASAWRAGELAFFRRFAELPVYDGRSPGTACVWFVDLRFDAPGRGELPFRYGVCREGPDSRWRAHQVRDGHPVPLRR